MLKLDKQKQLRLKCIFIDFPILGAVKYHLNWRYIVHRIYGHPQWWDLCSHNYPILLGFLMTCISPLLGNLHLHPFTVIAAPIVGLLPRNIVGLPKKTSHHRIPIRTGIATSCSKKRSRLELRCAHPKSVGMSPIIWVRDVTTVHSVGDLWYVMGILPSGKRLHSYGKSLFLMGKSTINCHFQ